MVRLSFLTVLSLVQYVFLDLKMLANIIVAEEEGTTGITFFGLNQMNRSILMKRLRMCS